MYNKCFIKKANSRNSRDNRSREESTEIKGTENKGFHAAGGHGDAHCADAPEEGHAAQLSSSPRERVWKLRAPAHITGPV